MFKFSCFFFTVENDGEASFNNEYNPSSITVVVEPLITKNFLPAGMWNVLHVSPIHSFTSLNYNN